MDYRKTRLKDTVTVNKIVTVHYFEYGKSYSFPGEAHNFWELVYVDRGEIGLRADEESFVLSRGEIAFHKPGEFHTVRANGKVAPNLVIISFCCDSKAMSFFENYRARIGENEKKLLSSIIKETSAAFSSPLEDPDMKKLERRRGFVDPGAEQMIRLSLEQLLISLLRSKPSADKNTLSASKNASRELTDKVMRYLEENCGRNLSFGEVCSLFNISPTGLKTAFKNNTGFGVIEYHRGLRIKKAKILIRESEYNMTQISDILGYDSIHSFSRQFKRVCGMSPTEYSATIER